MLPLLTLNGCILQDAAYVSASTIVNNTSMYLRADEVTIGNNTIIAFMSLNGNSSFNLTTADGCDSTVNVSFTVYPNPLVPVISQIFAATFEVINGPFDNYQVYLNSEIISWRNSFCFKFLSVWNIYS